MIVVGGRVGGVGVGVRVGVVNRSIRIYMVYDLIVFW